MQLSFIRKGLYFMKKKVIYKMLSILFLIANIGGLFTYTFSDKWFLLYDNSPFIYLSSALTIFCILALGNNEKADKWFLLIGLITSIPLIIFTVIFTVNTFRHGDSTFIFVTTICFLLFFLLANKKTEIR